MPARLLCVGALTLDTIFRFDKLPIGSGKFLPLEALQMAAGMAASAATAAQRLGGEVSLWASIGADAVGGNLIAQIEAEGVDCRLVRRVNGGRSAIATILVDADGERMIVPFYDLATQEGPEDLPFQGFDRFDAVLCDVRWPGAAELALAGATAAGLPAILDADVAPREVLGRLLPLASHVVASRPAVAILCGGDIEAGDAVEHLGRMTDAFVAMTDGSKGTYWLDRSTLTVRNIGAPQIEAIDTLAAGDVFHGSFALSVAEGADIVESIQFASAAAALKCRTFGGRLGAPRRQETMEFMRRWLNG